MLLLLKRIVKFENGEYIMFGHTELIIIAVIILILFGSAAIPKFFKSLGQAKSEFEKGVKESKTDEDKPTELS